MSVLFHALLRTALVAQVQAPAPAVVAVDTVRTRIVAPAPRYKASALQKAFLGNGWRDLWGTPVKAPLFNSDTFAGGLKFKERGGGMQTLSLHYETKDGFPEYLFRSVDKFPLIQAMPPELSGTLSGAFIQDQVSALLPGAAVLVAPLLDALGILRVSPGLYVMPDDPKLGVYRDTFAIMLGTVELNPQERPEDKPGFAGSTKIISADKFFDAVRETRAVRLDERELFASRLVDFLINDVDRTRDNVRFARFGENDSQRWRPIPRDRDHAFMDGRGWITAIAVRPIYPKMTPFAPTISLRGLVFGSHHVDRRLLQRLSGPDIDGIALRVRGAITDDVIEAVVAALPLEWREQTTAPDRIRTVLRARRDNLPGIARQFYAWLATEVDLHATDEVERTIIERHTDGRVTVTIAGAADTASTEPFIQRTFLPSETNEVRVHLHDGDDIAVIKGSSSGPMKVRVIGGKGADVLADSAGGGATHLYDTGNDNRISRSRGTHVSLKPWVPPVGGGGLQFDSPWRPDWGGNAGWSPTAGFVHGGGLVLGFGPRYSRSGFRRLPHRIELGANAMVGLGNGRPGIDASADYRMENSPVELHFNSRATQFEAFSFSGFGNATERLLNHGASVPHDIVRVEPSIVYQIGWRSRDSLNFGGLKPNDDSARGPKIRSLIGKLEAGVMANWTVSNPPEGSPFAEKVRGGRDAEGRVGARLRLTLDKTSSGDIPDLGFTLQSEIAGYPAFPGVNAAFGTASMTGTAYLPLIGNGTHIALLAGGAVASSPDIPLLNAPAVGGLGTLRGYDWRRFTGDRSAFGSAELRVPVGTLPLFIRWHTGVFGLADAGRVWFDGKSDGTWHTAVGGGIWLSTLGQTFSIAVVKGEKVGVYLRRGASF